MSFRISGKNLDIGEALRERVNARIAEVLAKYFDGGYSGHVTVAKDGFGFRTECAIHLDSGITLHTEANAADAYASADQAALLIEKRIPVFGVCLGLQGIVEYFGGSLGVLDVPMHGKPSVVQALPGRLLRGLPEQFTVGRYHSLFAERGSFPAVLSATAETEDGVIMAIEHKSLPIAAVQFHPESVMTSPGEIGMPILETALSVLCEKVAA